MYLPSPVQESVWIDLASTDIRPDARFHGDEEISGLARSLQQKQLQNVIVFRNGERYEVLAGVGRVMAARKLNWGQIRADVYEALTEFQKLAITFSENEDRKDAPALYQAKVLHEMMETDKLTQEQLAKQLEKDNTTISKYLALVDLSPKIWGDLNRFNSLGLRHFLLISRLENKDDQWKVAEMAVAKDLSVKELQAVVDKELGVKSGTKKMGRPKGTQSLGDKGFAIKQKKGSLAIRAVFPLNGDLDGFIASLREEIRSRQPKPTVSAIATPPAETAVN